MGRGMTGEGAMGSRGTQEIQRYLSFPSGPHLLKALYYTFQRGVESTSVTVGEPLSITT